MKPVATSSSDACVAAAELAGFCEGCERADPADDVRVHFAADDREQPPPDRRDILGAPEWLNETGGVIDSRRERAALVLHGLPDGARYLGHRVRASWWRRGRSKAEFEESWFSIPDDEPYTAAALDICERQLGPQAAMTNHSFRTFLFARALARRDSAPFDERLLFAAAMLHDVGLAAPIYRRCFTGRGADAAGTLPGCSPDQRAIIASAVSHHITPGLKKAGGPHALYIQRGSLLDLTGTRAIHLPRDFVQEVYLRYRPHDVKREAGARWCAEAAMVPHGRAHLLERYGRFRLVAKTSPLPPLELPPGGDG